MMAGQAQASSSSTPLLALISDPTRSRLIKQGAEAKAYRVDPFWPSPVVTGGNFEGGFVSPPLFSTPLLLKHRFPKTYRHPLLSSQLTLSRTQSEARLLVRCLRKGVCVPRLACLDEREGVVGMEWIEGRSVRELLGGGAEGEEERVAEHEQDEKEEVLDDESQLKLMRLVGIQLAKMHHADVIHGDLTTSNMMLRRASDKGKARATYAEGELGVARPLEEGDEVVLIDFGLSSTSPIAEDKAVDLYVLERAFASTHPASEHLFSMVLETYREVTERMWEESRRTAATAATATMAGGEGKPTGRKAKAEKGVPGVGTRNPWLETEKKLKEVRLRGRKRDMTG